MGRQKSRFDIMKPLFVFCLGILLAMRGVSAEVTSPIMVLNSFAPIVEKTSPGVVNIYTRKRLRSNSAARHLENSVFWRLFSDALLFGYGQDRIESSLGSGVIVSATGVIVTNHHVIEDAEEIAVALTDERVFAARVLLADESSDIAVLKIEAPGQPLPFVEFGDSDLLRVGDQVIAIGNPFGIGQTVTSGIVSGLARTAIGITDIRFFIQTDAAINPGNSGGAQIDMAGKLVGINTAIHSTSGGSQGLGFAIPSNMVKMIVENVMQKKPLVRPWIGLSGLRVPPQFAAALGVPAGKGVLVTEVYKNGPAATAGLRAGDVIMSIGGFPVNEFHALRYRIATRPPGGTVKIRLVRQRTDVEVVVSLIAPPDEPAANKRWLPATSALRGSRVASLSPAFAEELGLDSGIAGVIVLEAGAGSGANRLGIRKGDIIRGVNDHDIKTVNELLAFRISPFKPWSIDITRSAQRLVIKGGRI